MTFWEKLFILFGALWCFMLAFMFYTWKLQKKQQAVLHYIARRLASLEQLLTSSDPKATGVPTKTEKTKTAPSETVITIDKNEPISKYESVNLPDEININFVDR